jgi:hypothetical protein
MINTNEHDDLFPKVWFRRTYSSLRRPRRLGLFQLFASLKRAPRPVELASLSQGHQVPQGLHTKNWSLLPHFTIKRIRAREKRTIIDQIIARPCNTQMLLKLEILLKLSNLILLKLAPKCWLCKLELSNLLRWVKKVPRGICNLSKVWN